MSIWLRIGEWGSRPLISSAANRGPVVLWLPSGASTASSCLSMMSTPAPASTTYSAAIETE